MGASRVILANASKFIELTPLSQRLRKTVRWICHSSLVFVYGSWMVQTFYVATHNLPQPHMFGCQRTRTRFLQLVYPKKQKENHFGYATRNSSPPYRWASPVTRLKRETSFGVC
ncbi:hypothetical protein EEX84_15565 [Planococcus salinus]|uniref:Uncharacterized protein n=1 Tax=Planococcus salinus TaxID=1848460 RepID=A0A3M8P3C6_9BACL|nr:hypothetical protein EEX84_15565 [Planococcus salinus]